MLLWFAGTALVAVWMVFRDPAFDHRLVIVGALVPDVVDAPFGRAGVAHALITPVVVLTVVMLVTRGRRTRRRSWLAVPIGMFLHLVFDGAFREAVPFWWPFTGFSLGDVALPAVSRGWWNVALEVIGAAMLVWAWRTFGLAAADRRRAFLRTGRLVPVERP
jgi:hypothetical protein